MEEEGSVPMEKESKKYEKCFFENCEEDGVIDCEGKECENMSCKDHIYASEFRKTECIVL